MSRAAGDRVWVLLAPVLAVTAVAVTLFALTLARDGLDVIDAALASIFTVLFGWIAFWFWLTAIGAACLFRARREVFGPRSRSAAAATEPLPKTVLVLPIHNEDVEAVFARAEAMLESLEATGRGDRFELFVLSDTTDPGAWLREELAFYRLRRRCRVEAYYRRRANKFRKKSGNIADFCARWGDRYELMIVLDADSVMDGDTMLELVLRMKSAPSLGILQTPAMPALSRSLYARVQQFAASVYGPPVFAGLSYCFQGNATFWGHNAIVRVRPFVEHCGLPGLPGRPPFGGPILSHDFVEAALMRRAGYEVRLAWDLLAGSYELCPPSLAVAAARDRRWCQGNLQHLRLLLSPSFSWKSRIHFAIGVLFYVTAALWGLFVLFHALVFLQASGTVLPGRSLPWFVSPALLLAALACLFVAKLLGVGTVLADRRRTRELGGARCVLAGAAIETFLSVATAPVLMVSHVACVAGVLFGFTVDWGPAERGETESPFRDALVAHGWQSALGAFMGFSAFRLSAPLAAWTSPVWVGLLLAAPLAALLSSRRVGLALRTRGLFVAPGESTSVPILERVMRLTEESAAEAHALPDAFSRVVRDPWLNALHVALLEGTQARSRPRSVVSPLVDRFLDEGPEYLADEEALVLLSDAWAMRTLHEELALRAAQPVAGQLASI